MRIIIPFDSKSLEGENYLGAMMATDMCSGGRELIYERIYDMVEQGYADEFMQDTDHTEELNCMMNKELDRMSTIMEKNWDTLFCLIQPLVQDKVISQYHYVDALIPFGADTILQINQ